MRWSTRVEAFEAATAVMLAGGVAGVSTIVAIAAASMVFGVKQHERAGLVLFAVILFAASILQWALFGILSTAIDSSVYRLDAENHPLWSATQGYADGRAFIRQPLGLAALVIALAVGASDAIKFEGSSHPTTFGLTVVFYVLFLAIEVAKAFIFNAYMLAFLRAWRFPEAIARGFLKYRYMTDLALAMVLQIGISYGFQFRVGR